MGRIWRENAPPIVILALGLLAVLGAATAQLSHEHRDGQQPQSQSAESVQEHQTDGAVSGPPNQEATQREETEEDEPTDWVAITGLLLSFAGFVLVAGTFYLQRIATIGDLRAYIRIDVSRAHIDVGDALTVTIEPRNYGKTPAFKVKVFSNVFVRSSKWTWEKDFVDDRRKSESAFVLHPEEGHEVVCHMRDDNGKIVPLKLVHLTAIALGSECIFARFVVEYRDVFKRPRVSEKRFEFSGERAMETGKWSVSPRGSRAT